MSSTLSYNIPLVPEPRFEDPTLAEWARRVKDSVNQLVDSVNSLGSKVS